MPVALHPNPLRRLDAAAAPTWDLTGAATAATPLPDAAIAELVSQALAPKPAGGSGTGGCKGWLWRAERGRDSDGLFGNLPKGRLPLACLTSARCLVLTTGAAPPPDWQATRSVRCGGRWQTAAACTALQPRS